MRELSLFTGAGGGILGTKLLGWTPVGYVEWDDYCQRILRQRQEDEHIETAPIFSDIRAFISEGYAERYRGMVDVITAGFPCQPFSSAGNMEGIKHKANMWPETIRTICIIRPTYIFLENVPGLFANEYIRRIFRDMAQGGYDVRWRVLSAAEVGAPHKRDRVWFCGYSNGSGEPTMPINEKAPVMSQVEFTPGKRLEGAKQIKEQLHIGSQSSDSSWWLSEPNVGRVANGVASRVDRLKAIGNGQVPAVVRAAWELLTR